MKTVNALIVDDNPIISDCILKRLGKASERYSSDSDISIRAFQCQFSVYDSVVAARKFEDCINLNSIDFLLLDRGFFDIIDPVYKRDLNLDGDYLYVSNQQKNVKIIEILSHVSFRNIKKLQGIIVYSFDELYQTSEWYVEPVQIKREITDLVGEKVNEKDVEVILTNTEIYSLAGVNIYASAGKQYDDQYLYLGRKSDFSLYGLFVGELLYHRMERILNRKRRTSMVEKSRRTNRTLILLFLIFSGLAVGGNALYSLLYQWVGNNGTLLLLSLVFSIFLPVLVLLTKPDWIISIDEN